MKRKSFCTARKNIDKVKRHPTEWEKIFVSHTSKNGLISKIYKELIQLKSKKPNGQIKKRTKDLNRQLFQRRHKYPTGA